MENTDLRLLGAAGAFAFAAAATFGFTGGGILAQFLLAGAALLAAGSLFFIES